MSSYGVMRGLHFQRPPFTQSKLVRCVKGRVIIIPSFLTIKEGSTFLTKPSSIVFTPPSVPPVLGDRNPQGREDVTALLGAQNRFAIRLAGHQSPRHILRDGTAWG